MPTTDDSSYPHTSERLLLLVGDSDIERWPEKFYPCLQGVGASAAVDSHGNSFFSLSGHSGATLGQVLIHVRDALEDARGAADRKSPTIILVVCAGENDIGMGVSLETTKVNFSALLDLVFSDQTVAGSGGDLTHFIFLGPKFEPWMEYDNDSVGMKQAYAKLDRAFHRLCDEYAKRHENLSSNIHYIDCLDMFCGDTSNLPGARTGGRAVAKEEFFCSDQLHLSDDGYAVWKETVERIIKKKCL
ncbi:GDSL-like lipase/acylhydrolase family protein [Nitzschia inconspicua]|uniref:GDSL-like lipase/acylhydrolase family protein n=1 Tax=Nitzschia inconspicua TaxID=303405 RepID=A0A9K3PKW5_9STRA|nr:GDSL-like lipase/acylhydrolase family protein [Nitzschia inconspicua]